MAEWSSLHHVDGFLVRTVNGSDPEGVIRLLLLKLCFSDSSLSLISSVRKYMLMIGFDRLDKGINNLFNKWLLMISLMTFR